MKGRVFVLSGPSGSGKSTLIRDVRKRIDNLVYSISYTTRGPRLNEKEGVDYFFIDNTTFVDMIEKDAFLEWARVYGDYYGTSRGSAEEKLNAGSDMILDIDNQGAKSIKENINDCRLIYILPPSIEILEKRLRKRATDNSAVIEKRIKQVNNELSNCEWYDYLIINDDLEKAAGELEAIIIADRCSRERALPDIEIKFKI
ncbi:guanylate kinase [Thermodesulfobacteriota bacterium]